MNLMTTIMSMQKLFLQGMLTTLRLWGVALVVSLVVGCVWGVLRSRKVRIAVVSIVFDVVTFVLRGIPFYVQLLLAYFVIPKMLGFSMSAFWAASVSLGLCSAAYVSQMVRGGMNAVVDGQWLAAQSLGYSRVQALRFVVLPQVVRNILPALTGELDQLLKSTSVISALGVLELTRVGMNIVARTMDPLPVYLSIAVLYLAISSLLTCGAWFLERRLS